MITYLQFEKLPLKKGPWSTEEDQALIAYIKRYGIWNWNEMPKAAGLLRSGKSCRLRWMNYLRPNLKHGNFTEEEDEIILTLHQKLGNRWSAIARKLPGRSDNEIKNHWHSHLKKRYNNTVPVQQKSKPPEIKERKKSAEKFVSDFPVLDSSSSKEDEIVFSPEFYQNLDQYLQDQENQETDSQMLIDYENSWNHSISPTALSSSSNSTIWPDIWENTDQSMWPNEDINVWLSDEQVPNMWEHQPFLMGEDFGNMDYMETF